MIPSPKKLEDLPYGTILQAGLGTSTVIADMDFETYSPAGFVWDASLNKWKPPRGAAKKGLPVVGAAVYSEHPDTEVLCLAYDLKDGLGRRQWIPQRFDTNFPYDLFEHLLRGRLIEAWNIAFERWVWNNVCVPKYGFPLLPDHQLRCAMAKSRAHALPGSLKNAGDVLNLSQKKDKRGDQLIQRFCIPRDPTKQNPLKRNWPSYDIVENGMRQYYVDDETEELYKYNLQDIATEAEASSRMPDLSPAELEYWQCDQRINARGVQIDLKSIEGCIAIIEQAYAKYNAELATLTNGVVTKASQVAKILKWVNVQHALIYQKTPGMINETTWINSRSFKGIEDLTDETVNDFLGSHGEIAEYRNICRVLEIRQMLGSASVKKLYAMANQASRAGRLHDLFVYHSARTGRAAGAGPQPQNLPNSGEPLRMCEQWGCARHFQHTNDICPWCGHKKYLFVEWSPEAVDDALEIAQHGNLNLMEYYFDNAIGTISGCLRGLFVAKKGHDLISSDYSAIEAVVAATLSGEQWRIDVFNTHGKIYEMSASKITGTPFDEIVNFEKNTGSKHALRKIGKVAELASGYQGWIGAWERFGATEFYDAEVKKQVAIDNVNFPEKDFPTLVNIDEYFYKRETVNKIKNAILAWRAASPKIVEMWGGQERNWQPEFYGLEGMAILAVQNPGQEFIYRRIGYIVKGDVLYCRLLSGRYLTYHRPRLSQSTRKNKEHLLQLSYEGWNTNPENGGIGWIRINTYGGKLFENVVQATARDILMHAIVSLEKSGYPVVLHVHDEIVCEVPNDFGTIQELENIMSVMPHWASDWPIRAKGGWRGYRYRK